MFTNETLKYIFKTSEFHYSRRCRVMSIEHRADSEWSVFRRLRRQCNAISTVLTIALCLSDYPTSFTRVSWQNERTVCRYSDTIRKINEMRANCKKFISNSTQLVTGEHLLRSKILARSDPAHHEISSVSPSAELLVISIAEIHAISCALIPW